MSDNDYEAQATTKMCQAFTLLNISNKTRENSLAITKVEEAMMWNNKDRTIKGQLKPYNTHVKIE